MKRTRTPLQTSWGGVMVLALLSCVWGLLCVATPAWAEIKEVDSAQDLADALGLEGSGKPSKYTVDDNGEHVLTLINASSLNACSSGQVNINMTGNVTLDCKNQTLKTKGLILVYGSSQLTIKGSNGGGINKTSGSNNTIQVGANGVTGGDVVVDGATIKNSTAGNTAYAFSVTYGGNATLKGGGSFINEIYGGMSTAKGATFNLEGGTIRSNDVAVLAQDGPAAVNLKQGTIETTGDGGGHTPKAIQAGENVYVGTQGGNNNDLTITCAKGDGIQCMIASSLTVYSGTITGNGEDGCGIAVLNDPKLAGVPGSPPAASSEPVSVKIQGGTITGEAAGISLESGEQVTGITDLNISGGEISATDAGDGSAILLSGQNADVDITGGTVDGDIKTASSAGASEGQTSSVTISDNATVTGDVINESDKTTTTIGSEENPSQTTPAIGGSLYSKAGTTNLYSGSVKGNVETSGQGTTTLGSQENSNCVPKVEGNIETGGDDSTKASTTVYNANIEGDVTTGNGGTTDLQSGSVGGDVISNGGETTIGSSSGTGPTIGGSLQATSGTLTYQSGNVQGTVPDSALPKDALVVTTGTGKTVTGSSPLNLSSFSGPFTVTRTPSTGTSSIKVGSGVQVFNQSSSTISVISPKGSFTLESGLNLTTPSGSSSTTDPEPTPDTTDFEKLNAAIAAADALTQSAYTQQSWASLQSVLASARLVASDPKATQAEVDSALQALNAAMKALVSAPTVDTSSLAAAISKAESLVESAYTPESWQALEAALTSAQEVLDNQNATQQDINSALGALQAAMDALVKNPNTPDNPNNPDTPTTPTPIGVYRLYNARLDGAHLLTADKNEISWLTNPSHNTGWALEEETPFFYEYAKDATQEGTTLRPVYRLQNPANNDHFYTASTKERDALEGAGWVSEGVAFRTPLSGTTQVSRLYNSHQTANQGLGNHLWTTDQNEVNYLTKINVPTWTNETNASTCWFSLTTPTQ